MLNPARIWLRQRPRIYDISVRAWRALAIKSTTYDALNEFSKAHHCAVRLIQIGASDGLHGDPIREFVVRDRWSGVFVEPLPYSFGRLKSNYRYLHRPDLTFVNAVVIAFDTTTLQFWTFSDSFLLYPI